MKTDIASTRSLRRSSARVVYVAVVRVCVAGGLLIICLINMSSQDVPDAPHGSPPTTAYARAGYVAGSLVDEPLTPISTATPAPRPLATGTHELEWADKKLGRPAALAANGVLGAAALKGMDDEMMRLLGIPTCMRRKASQSGRWKLISPPKIPDDPQSHATSKSTDRPTDHIDEAEEGVGIPK